MMNIARIGIRIGVGVVATAVATTAIAVPGAQAHSSRHLGTTSLATVLTTDMSGFDRNARDFDVLTAAVQAVLKAKPNSPVKVLTDGKVALTTFAPTDAAFRQLAKEVTGQRGLPGERAAFTTVAGLGIDTVETSCCTTSFQGPRSTAARPSGPTVPSSPPPSAQLSQWTSAGTHPFA
ncbi:MAG TPA: hypothetical protein VF755_26170 [Catenuloplanes sp.]